MTKYVCARPSVGQPQEDNRQMVTKSWEPQRKLAGCFQSGVQLCGCLCCNLGGGRGGCKGLFLGIKLRALHMLSPIALAVDIGNKQTKPNLAWWHRSC